MPYTMMTNGSQFSNSANSQCLCGHLACSVCPLSGALECGQAGTVRPKTLPTPGLRDLLGLLCLPLLRRLQEGGGILPPQDGHIVLQLAHLRLQGPLPSQVRVLAFLHMGGSRRSSRLQCAWTGLPWCKSYQIQRKCEGNGAIKVHAPGTAQTRAPHFCRAALFLSCSASVTGSIAAARTGLLLGCSLCRSSRCRQHAALCTQAQST